MKNEFLFRIKEELLLLIHKKLAGTATEEEIALLHHYYEQLQDAEEWPSETLGDPAIAGDRVLGNILAEIQAVQEVPQLKSRNTVRIWKYTAAVVAACMAGTLLITIVLKNRRQPIAAAGKKEILPATEKAVLRMTNGAVYQLTDTTMGQQLFTVTGGRIAFAQGRPDTARGGAGLPATEQMNTLTTPRGGSFTLQLADGSLVRLNAASSISFPASFNGRERRVSIEGEAYFEIAQDKTKPFIVAVKGSEIQVLGTHFNVTAYEDEKRVTTTLLEGAVKVTHEKESVILSPGQQSQLDEQGHLSVVKNKAEQDEAWFKDYFHFRNENMDQVLRQLSRWYDVEVDMNNHALTDSINADIPKETNLSDALKALELAGAARFEIRGRKIVVL